MPDVGYPDYARFSRSGQFQLYFGANVTPTYDVPFFQGYVGLWPFINVFTNMAASTDFMQITYLWFSDSTFTTAIAFRAAVRGGNNLAYAQYANLSDWLQVFYTTKSGLAMQFRAISIYGTQQRSGAREIASQDTALSSFNGSVAASTTLVVPITKIIPGDSLFNLLSGAVGWNLNFFYYDFGLGAYQKYYGMTQNGFTDSAGHIFVPVLDCPLQIQIQNQDTSPRSFNYIWAAMSL
jgi:hypothetical protein